MLVATVAALVLTALMLWGFALAKRGVLAPSSPAAGLATQVVAVSKDLPVNATLATADLEFTPVAAAEVNTDNVTTFASVIGQTTTVHLTRNSVLLHSDLTGLPVNPYAVKLAPRHVAVSVRFDEESDFGGYAQPGDHIDVICGNGDGTASYCFTNLLVMQVGGRSEQPTPGLRSGPSGLTNPAAGAVPPVISGAVLLVLDMTYADALAMEAHLLIGSVPTKDHAIGPVPAKGYVIGYALGSAVDSSSPPSMSMNAGEPPHVASGPKG